MNSCHRSSEKKTIKYRLKISIVGFTENMVITHKEKDRVNLC